MNSEDQRDKARATLAKVLRDPAVEQRRRMAAGIDQAGAD